MNAITFSQLRKAISESVNDSFSKTRPRYKLTLVKSNAVSQTKNNKMYFNCIDVYWDKETTGAYERGDVASVIKADLPFNGKAEEIANLKEGTYAIVVENYPFGKIVEIRRIRPNQEI